MSATKYIIEIATSDFATTRSAVEGGADRIELCANLAEGGTTASYGTLVQCREKFSLPIYPIIRSRGGDFLYTDEEFGIMLKDVKLCRQLGFDGVVIGFLHIDGTIDVERTSELIEAAYPLEVTFHRAFDRCKDPFEAMEELIKIGCERILTSGQQPTAPEGVGLLASLNKAADQRIIIMPGSGVSTKNIQSLKESTGCTEFHASLRRKEESKMKFIHPSFKDSEESYMNNSILAEEVKALKEALS
ncbi:MAG: copper homeostasis protein CutC [Chitinophagaceae bacterium]|nr:copper homeostasis protein CutC [Chitinophagaceae bacterium]